MIELDSTFAGFTRYAVSLPGETHKHRGIKVNNTLHNQLSEYLRKRSCGLGMGSFSSSVSNSPWQLADVESSNQFSNGASRIRRGEKEASVNTQLHVAQAMVTLAPPSSTYFLSNAVSCDASLLTKGSGSTDDWETTDMRTCTQPRCAAEVWTGEVEGRVC